MASWAVLLLALSSITLVAGNECKSDSVWAWVCQNERCVKVEADSTSSGQTLETCKMTCGKYGTLWPKPTGSTMIGKEVVQFIPSNMMWPAVHCAGKSCAGHASSHLLWMINNAFTLTRNDLQETYDKLKTEDYKAKCRSVSARGRYIKTDVFVASTTSQLTLETDESYILSITQNGNDIHVNISASTFFGARHALETMTQLTAYDGVYNTLQMVSAAAIVDKPSYPYRGILLDTSRNFFSVKSIMNLVKAMSFSKMNTLHWHITDTHSFPIEIKSLPDMLRYGAYNDRKIYTQADVKKIVDYATLRGVRILPEFDQPAHCGNGWQWGEKAGLGKLAVCVGKEPWTSYCVEPPCGQLNPINENVYPILGKIYQEYMDLFKPDIFHAGGDEVHTNCWDTTDEIVKYMEKVYGGRTERDYMTLWSMFVNKTEKLIYKANNDKKLPLILWSSHLTKKDYLTDFLNPKKYIIQIWTTTKDEDLANIVKSGFKTIFSTYDTLYLDCGYGNWLTMGNNWCSPYKDWKLYYNNDPVQILDKNFHIKATDEMKKSILGQEAAMWSEQVDDQSSESKIWPRAAALGERLWTNPAHDWREAQYRMISHRERLVNRGIHADALQPLWCHQNEGLCYI